ncbi:MAG: RluA family pseudouridine synthase [Planctomycetes bacterium]|nr:RluA family pseudouridine synthase [Planctomycetota bacterium]
MTHALLVLHCDNHVLVVAKPAGIPSVPDASGDESLLELSKNWVGERYAKPGAVFLGVVQRLDRPVSGVMVFARTSKAAARLAEVLREQRARKTYWAIGEGSAREDEGELVQFLWKDEERNRVHVCGRSRQDAREARTRWRVLERDAGRTLYEFQPATGRSHQLRVAAATLGTPLLGDLKYGARAPLEDQSIALHARELAFEHPVTHEELRFEAELPALATWDAARRRLTRS